MSEENKMFSQEELNSIISDRLNKEKTKYEEQLKNMEAQNTSYKDQIAKFNTQLEEINKKVAEHEAAMKEKDAKIHDYETQSVKMRVAREMDIPYELAMRLNGETEDDIKKDADIIKALFNQAKPSQPLGSTETSSGTNQEAGWRQIADSLIKK